MMDNQLVIVLVTAPQDKSLELAKKIVQSRLAACVNLIKGVSSIYWWQGKIVEDKEDILIIKTKECLINKLKKFIKENHPYEVPEIVFLKSLDVFEEYLRWVISSTVNCKG